jgi:hypothetical protein
MLQRKSSGGETRYTPMKFTSQLDQCHSDQLYDENRVQLSKIAILHQPLKGTSKQYNSLLDSHLLDIHSLFPYDSDKNMSAKAIPIDLN